jgi:hypothetical protein
MNKIFPKLSLSFYYSGRECLVGPMVCVSPTSSLVETVYIINVVFLPNLDYITWGNRVYLIIFLPTEFYIYESDRHTTSSGKKMVVASTGDN